MGVSNGAYFVIFALKGAFTVEVEIRVVGEIYDSKSIAGGFVVDADGIVFSDSVGDFDFDFARESGIAVGADQGEFEGEVVNDFSFPHSSAVAQHSVETVRTVVAVVAEQLICFSAEGESTLTDTVCDASDECAEEIGVCLVGFRFLITEVDIDHISITVRSEDGNNGTAHIGNGDSEAAGVFQRVKFGCSAVGCLEEITDFHRLSSLCRIL